MSTVPLVTNSRVVSCVASCDTWGGISLPSTLVSLANQIAQVANIAAPQLPWAAIVVAPISFHGVIKKVRNKWRQAHLATCIADKVFWGLQGISSVGKAISRAIQPLIGTLGLAGFRTTGTAALIFQRIFPIVMIATSALGLIASVWALVKRAKDYTKCPLPELDKVREVYLQNKNDSTFKRLYCFHDLDLARLEDSPEGNKKLLRELKVGKYFNLANHLRSIVVASMGLAGSVLLIAAPQYQTISSVLFISSSGVELLILIVKNSLMYKSRSMLRSQACPIKVL